MKEGKMSNWTDFENSFYILSNTFCINFYINSIILGMMSNEFLMDRSSHCKKDGKVHNYIQYHRHNTPKGNVFFRHKYFYLSKSLIHNQDIHFNLNCYILSNFKSILYFYLNIFNIYIWYNIITFAYVVHF